jgi:cyanophycinase
MLTIDRPATRGVVVRRTRGEVMVVGGHEDHSGARHILREFVRLAGGETAQIAVVATAAQDPDAAADGYVEAFQRLGVASCKGVHVAEREDAADAEVAASLADVSGIFFTGGDQLRITAVLGGTAAEAAIVRAHRQGAVVAGTSAGASAMSSTMIVGGESDASPRREVVRMSPGLGLLPELVIDQHFAQRGRLSRLLAAIGQNPGILGVGVDEDTAFVVDPEGMLRVVGSATVTILDGRGIRLSSASEADLEQSLTVTGVTLHILAEGYRFDLRSRRPRAPLPTE